MGAIDTEEAAKRLARVILSDIELYSRERPKEGETLETQIEEGRRLFASRVSPALLPLFAVVLADRQKRAATGALTPALVPVARAAATTAPAAAKAATTDAAVPAVPFVPAVPAVPAAPAVPAFATASAVPVVEPSVETSRISNGASADDRPALAPEPAAVESLVFDRPTPVVAIRPADYAEELTPGPVVAASVLADKPAPEPSSRVPRRGVATPPPELVPRAPIAAPARLSTPAPARIVTPPPARISTPAPVRISTPAPVRLSTPVPVRASTPAPARILTPVPGAVALATAPPAAAPVAPSLSPAASEIPVPELTAHVSVLSVVKVLVLIAAVAGTVMLLLHFTR